jgi:hypothetical protein
MFTERDTQSEKKRERERYIHRYIVGRKKKTKNQLKYFVHMVPDNSSNSY